MELLPLSPKDSSELLALIKKSTPGLEFVDKRVLEEQAFADPESDTSFLIKAVEKKRMAGALIGVARKSGSGQSLLKTGYVKYFGVLPKFRRQGAGQAMFSELERRFQKRDTREVRVGGCPPPFLQGGVEVTDTASVSFLLKRGYARLGETIDMTAPLSRWKPLEQDGDKAQMKAFAIRKAKAADEKALLDMAAANFPGWAFEILAGLKKGVVWMAEENGACVAFCCGNATNPGFFGPMGTVESLRGKGLARILLNRTLESMKKSGCKSARIPWVGPIPFYAKYAGASLGPIYWNFSKKL